MIRCNFSTTLRLAAIVLAVSVITVPVTPNTDDVGLEWSTALAKKGGNGGGPGNGGGRGGGNGGGRGGGNHGGGHDGGGHGKGRGGGHDRPGNGHGRANHDAEYRDLDEFVDQVRRGNAFGHARRDERVERAKGRYGKALGRSVEDGDAADVANDDVAERIPPGQTKKLIERGWRARQAPADGFKNHGQRVRTMVELAKRLGYGARVGAMQANFGTPYETGIAALQAELAEARAAAAADPDDAEAAAEVERLNAELREAIEAAKPGNGPDDSWATADLDVNDDGAVDARDLAALDPADEDEATTEDAEATDDDPSDGGSDETADAEGDDTPAS